jgi:hypothetical protein
MIHSTLLTRALLTSALAGPALLAVAATSGCAPACPEGFTETEDGKCLRNHYGSEDTSALGYDPNGNGGSGADAPQLNLTQSRYATDDGGVPFLEIALTAQDPQQDIVGGSLHILLDETGNYDRPIVAGVMGSQDYESAQFDDPNLWFSIPNVGAEDHVADITATDAAGNVSAPLHITTSSAPQ